MDLAWAQQGGVKSGAIVFTSPGFAALTLPPSSLLTACPRDSTSYRGTEVGRVEKKLVLNERNFQWLSASLTFKSRLF